MLHTDNQDLKPKFSIFAVTLGAECWLLSAKEKHEILNKSEFSNKINICTQWRTLKVSLGGLMFRRAVTPQINIMQSAEGKTGWYGGKLWKKIAKLHQKYAFSCILEARCSIMLFSRLSRRMKS